MPEFRHRRPRSGYYPRYVYPESPVIYYPDATSEAGCSCKAGSQIEQKIKDNPLLAVIAALFAGFLIAKNR